VNCKLKWLVFCVLKILCLHCLLKITLFMNEMWLWKPLLTTTVDITYKVMANKLG